METIHTEIIKIDPQHIDKTNIKLAAEALREGQTVAFPTETVYGLGANALDEAAIAKIFKAKGRPQDNPLIVHVASIDQVSELVASVPERARMLMEKFWPGPLTILFNKSSHVPQAITAGLSTVAIRMPNHPIALEIIKEAGIPVAAPSANTSGKPSPTDASHVIEDLAGRANMVVDGGPTGVGVESTVIDISTDIPTILRPGGITSEDLLSVFPEIQLDPALEEDNKNLIPKSPGQKYKHYAPRAKMLIVQGNEKAVINRIKALKTTYEDEGYRVGIMATKETEGHYTGEDILIVGSRQEPKTVATNLFKTLRDFDKIGVDIILAEGVEPKGIGMAVMNRMKKAAGGNVEEI